MLGREAAIRRRTFQKVEVTREKTFYVFLLLFQLKNTVLKTHAQKLTKKKTKNKCKKIQGKK